MNRAVSTSLAVAVVLLLAGGFLLWQRYQRVQASYSNLQSTQDATQLRYGDALIAIAEIQDSLGTLGVPEAMRPVLPGSPATDRGLAVLRGREALDRIALLKAGIEHTKERLADLERRSRLSKVKVQGLERIIMHLRVSVVEREAQITELSNRVDSLNIQVTGLHEQVQATTQVVQEREVTIAKQRRELGTVYVVMGTQRELLRIGAIRMAGGVVGLGTTVVPSREASDSLFTPLDTDEERVIRIPAARARLLSAQPVTSYTLTSADKQTELRIVDPQAFRTVKRVVILLQP